MSKCRRGSFFLVFVSTIIFICSNVALASNEILQKKCSRCHSAKIVENKKGLSTNQWTTVINSMITKGLVINSKDAKALAKYLSETYK